MFKFPNRQTLPPLPIKKNLGNIFFWILPKREEGNFKFAILQYHNFFNLDFFKFPKIKIPIEIREMNFPKLFIARELWFKFEFNFWENYSIHQEGKEDFRLKSLGNQS